MRLLHPSAATRLVLATLFSAALFAPAALAAGESAKFTASDLLQGAAFGRSVAMDGTRVLVGANNHGSSGPFFYDGPGAAYVFEPSPGGWIETAKLTPSDAATGDWFGYAVDLSGDRAIVGAIGDDDAGSSSGSAYVFRFDGASWIEEGKLVAAALRRDDWFGTSVAIHGDVAVVGAPQNDLTAPGRAFVFRFDGASWLEEAELIALDAGARDDFGIAVDVEGEVAVVGAWNHGNTGQSFPDGTGAAYVFRFDGAAWSQEAKLVSTAPLPGELDRFGRAVALRGDRILAGTEPIGFTDPAPVGAAYLFRFDGSSWAGEAKLVASDAAPGDRFGYSVALDSGVAVAGAWGAWSLPTPCTQNPPFPGVCNCGAAYVFRLSGGSWSEAARLDASDIAEGDLLGWSVAVSGDRVVAGAWRDDDAGPDTGAAYLFATAPAWTDLGGALGGACGTPQLHGKGSLAAGASVTLDVTSACAAALGVLFVGLDRIDLPFRGGLLVPRPDLLAVFTTGALGGFSLTAPVGVPPAPGTSLFVQAWIADAGAPAGFAATNAVTAEAP